MPFLGQWEYNGLDLQFLPFPKLYRPGTQILAVELSLVPRMKIFLLKGKKKKIKKE